MNIDELKLQKFNHYKYKSHKYDKHYVFCIVYDVKNNRILEVRDSLAKADFDENKFREGLDSRKNSLKKRVQFYYLPVSNNEQIIKNFITLKEKWYEVNETLKNENLLSKFFSKIKFFIKKYYKSLIIFLFAIYSSFFYYALTDIGIPLSTVNVSLQELLSIMLYYLSGPISLIILYFLIAFVSYSIIPIIFKSIAKLILWKSKKPTIYFHVKEVGVIKLIYNICVNGLFVIMILIYLILLFFPLAHMLYDISLKQKPFTISRADKYQPYYLYIEYLQKIGYPKIAIEKGKKYILVGHDKSYEYVYDLNLTKQYIINKKNVNYEQFCRNIVDDNSTTNQIYEFMRNSPYIKANNTMQVKIKDSNFKYKNLGYIAADLNLTKINNDCEDYIKEDKIK